MKLGIAARRERAESGPKMVYWGKPRRGMTPCMLERDRREQCGVGEEAGAA